MLYIELSYSKYALFRVKRVNSSQVFFLLFAAYVCVWFSEGVFRVCTEMAGTKDGAHVYTTYVYAIRVYC